MNIENINNKAKLLIEETYKDSAKWHQNFNEAKQLLESALAQESNNETSLINYAKAGTLTWQAYFDPMSH